MTCEQVRRDSLSERYLLGELAEAAADEFEQHFFACRSCFEELKTLSALERELREAPAAPEIPAPRSWMGGWRWAWAGLPLALGAFVSMLSRPPVAQVPAARQAAPAASPEDRLLELARFQPPRYEESLLRGAEPRAGRGFHQAMAHYRRGEYEQAIAGLRDAVRADSKDPGSRFFLGICLLLTGRREAGIDALRASIALGDSSYLEEARFYQAKALLGQGELQPARRQLEAVIAMRGDLEPEARNLLGKLPGAP